MCSFRTCFWMPLCSESRQWRSEWNQLKKLINWIASLPILQEFQLSLEELVWQMLFWSGNYVSAQRSDSLNDIIQKYIKQPYTIWYTVSAAASLSPIIFAYSEFLFLCVYSFSCFVLCSVYKAFFSIFVANSFSAHQ